MVPREEKMLEVFYDILYLLRSNEWIVITASKKPPVFLRMDENGVIRIKVENDEYTIGSMESLLTNKTEALKAVLKVEEFKQILTVMMYNIGSVKIMGLIKRTAP